jgi:hypothetical protein
VGIRETGKEAGPPPLAAQWASSVLVSEEHVKLELFSIYMLQQALSCVGGPQNDGGAPTMYGVHEVKLALRHHGLVRCPTIEQLFCQLNGVKMRLLGPKCEFIPPPGDKGKADKAKPTKDKRRGAGGNDEASPAPTAWQLTAKVISVKNVRNGSAQVLARLKVESQRYATTPVRRTGGGGSSSAHFGDTEFVWSDVCHEREDSTLEVRLCEESSFGVGETLLGRAEVQLEGLKGNKAKLAEWHELRKNGKPCGEVCVEVMLTQSAARSDGKKRRGVRREGTWSHLNASSAVDALLADDGDESLEFLTLSGGWCGYTWHAPLQANAEVRATRHSKEVDGSLFLGRHHLRGRMMTWPPPP